jgi:type I restriction enzyme S subunit
MELREGYKNTEVGIIPEGWEIHTFGDIVDYTKGFAFKSKDYRKDGIRIIRVSDTTFDSIKKENGIYVDEKSENEYKNWRLEENDLIFTTVGSKPPMYDSMVGKVIMIAKENAGSFLNQNAVLIRSKKRTKEKQSLLLSHFRTKRYLQHIELIYRGNANQASITLKELFEFKIPLPKEEAEQTAIATALSDADALINSLEKLIAKKRNIKQGVMQKLLQPKEGWEVKSIQEVINGGFIIGHLDGNHGELYPRSEEFVESGIPYVGATDFRNGLVDFNNCKFLSVERAKTFRKGIARNGDVLFAHNATVGPVSFLKTSLEFVIISTTATYFRCDNKNLINSFLFYSLQSQNFVSQYQSVMLQSTRAQVPIGQQRKFFLNIPPSEEQTRIATILSDMDAEISALETKLEKYKKVKLGMMQNLLTGKIRLV